MPAKDVESLTFVQCDELVISFALNPNYASESDSDRRTQSKPPSERRQHDGIVSMNTSSLTAKCTNQHAIANGLAA